jgi:hypothetical protein
MIKRGNIRFKREFRRLAISSVPATIGIDRLIFGGYRGNAASAWSSKNTISLSNDTEGREQSTRHGSRLKCLRAECERTVRSIGRYRHREFAGIARLRLDQIAAPWKRISGADGEVHVCAVEGSQLEILPSLRHSILVETPQLVTDLRGFLLEAV